MTLSRREWLASMLGAPLAATLLAQGCDTPADSTREIAGTLLGPSMSHGHLLRNSATTSPDARVTDAPVHDVLILGGGPSGLSAA